MDWMKKNWLTVLYSLIALLCGADVSAGLSSGKALLNVTNIPSLLAMLASGGFLSFTGVKAVMNRPATAKPLNPVKSPVLVSAASDVIDVEMQKMQHIFAVAESADVTDEMIANLSSIAAATVVGHANRVKGTVVTMLVLFGLLSLSGCNLLSSLSAGGKIDTNKPVPSVVFSEQDYWDQLAKNVNADVFSNSDDLCYAVDCLVKTGELKDVSRIASIRKTRIEPIDTAAKLSISTALKGQ